MLPTAAPVIDPVVTQEPTLDDLVGVVTENMAGKTLFVGIGDVLARG